MKVNWLYVGGAAALGFVLMGLKSAMAYVNGKPVGALPVETVDGVLMTRELAKRWRAMKADAAKQGVALKVNSGFRTQEEQQRLYAEKLSGKRTDPVAKPGFSNHQSGVAIDIEVHHSTTSAEYRWLTANASKYGLTNVGAGFKPPEYWHWELKAGAPPLPLRSV